MKVPSSYPPPVAFNWADAPIRDWDLRDCEVQVASRGGIGSDDRDPIKWYRAKLGPQAWCVNHEGRRWWVWQNPEYTFYASSFGHVSVVPPEGVAPVLAAEAVLWDCGVLGHVLTRCERDEWVAFGRRLAEPHVEVFADYNQEELKQFVLDYCDGHIYCDHQCDQSILQMVFLPLAMGGMGTIAPDKEEGTQGSPAWHAEQKLPPHPGDKPKRTDKPIAPTVPTGPLPPDVPVFVTAQLEDIEANRISDHYANNPDVEVQGVTDLFIGGSSRNLDEYHEGIERQNAELQLNYELVMDKWNKAMTLLNRSYKDDLKAHETEMNAWRKSKSTLKVQIVAWKRQAEINEAASRGFTSTRLQNLGVIYEEIRKAGPRSINGQPIFWSLRIINRTDWLRCHKVIVRELSRREDMEI